MNSTLLKAHKDLYANDSIKSRAKKIKVIELSHSPNQYVFSCKGSTYEHYKITFIQKGNNIYSQCTCPYDWGGWCKHQVAVANAILTKNKNKLNPNTNAKDPIKHGEISLTNHAFTDEIVDFLIGDYNYYYYSRAKIQEVSSSKIVTSFDAWEPFTQIFLYNSETSLLKITCTCSASKRESCEHIAAGTHQIINVFGHDIFNPNYLNHYIDQFLIPYGLSRDTDEYKAFFDFKLGLKGPMAIEKIKNLAISLETIKEDVTPAIDSQELDSLHILKEKNPKEKIYGIGFCLAMSNRKNLNDFDLIPFRAKLKKRSPEFVSLYKEIDAYTMFDLFSDINEEEKTHVIKALELSQLNYSLSENFDVVYLKKASLAFHQFIKTTKSYPFFTKKHHAKVSKKNLTPISISDKKAVLSFNLEEKEHSYSFKAKLTIDDKSYNADSTLIKVFPLFCTLKKTVYLYDTINTFIHLNKLQGKSEINFQKKEYPKLYKGFIESFAKHFEIKTSVFNKSKDKITSDRLKKQVFLSDYEGEYVIFKLGVLYDKKQILIHSKETLFNSETQTYTPRNKSFEDNFLEEFKDLHPAFQEQENLFFLTPFQLIEEEWLLKASEKMKHKGIEIFGAKDLKTFKYNLHKPTISMGVKSDIDWFDLEIQVKFGKETVSLKDIRKALVNKSKFIQLNDGSLGVLPEKWLNKFAKYFKAGEVTKDRIKISNFQFNIIDELHDDLETTPKFLIELQKKKLRLQNLETDIDVSIPKGLKATLRPYQKQGLNWLVFLDKNKLGGCLADDMGLGKTLEAIAFLGYLKKKKKQKPHLVIMPTSLIFNWKKEIEKFFPSLKALIYTGPKRKVLFKDFSKYDIILSTYGSLLNDIEFMKDFEFGYVILDESQAIKNPNSKRYKAVKLLQSDNRLALTGTPIENNTFDLYAQMNFLNPGLLGNMSHFKKEFSDAIDKAKDEQTSTLLSEMIHPFLLRRTKEQVATDLPEKTETILYCEMGVEQRKVYESFKEKFRDYLLNKIDENGVAKSQMYVLEGLMKLRQICNSPELLNDEEDYGTASVKLDILTENIKEKTSNHKILVFSQFTSMLSLIKNRLEEENITYEYLDGRTKNREEKVKNFQENEEIRVFLISLKAGGVGLNLTAADYVFLVDPWWNPAVENQAIDRAHRIGQDKKVIAYKMICRDTIEEKIINLQNTKKQISNSIIQIDKVKKSFNKAQIKELFS